MLADLIGRGSSAGNLNDINDLFFSVEIKKNPKVAGARPNVRISGGQCRR